MTLVSRIALGAALALGGLGATVGAPAIAQQLQPLQPAVATANLSGEERAALLALDSALQAHDYVTAASALATAQSRARGGDARYLTASLQLRLGLDTNNPALQGAAIDAIIASGGAPAADLPQLYKDQGALALGNGKYDKAEAAFDRWAELAPNDPEALLSLAEVKNDRKKVPEAEALIDRAIEIRRSSGQPVPESWYRRGLKHAFDGHMTPQALKLSRELVAAYPTPENWRDAILIYRESAQPDAATTLDLFRLMRAAKALGGERDYQEMAQALGGADLAGEAKSVLDEGVAGKMIDPAKPAFKELIATTGKRAAVDRAALKGLEAKAAAAATGIAALAGGDSFFGAGDYAKAAALYRMAIEKGSVDGDLANTRLAMALALAGRKAEAEAAFRIVSGQRADLAGLWLAWLAQRG